MNAARRGDAFVRSDSAAAEGKRRVDAMCADFHRLLVAERRESATWQARADTAA